MKEKKKNKNRIALITGSAQRIGRMLALNLAEQGYSIALHYNSSKNQAQKTQSDITNLVNVNGDKIQCQIFYADFMSTKSVSLLFDHCIDAFGGLDLIINNASYYVANELTASDMNAMMEQVFSLNLRAPLILSKKLGQWVYKQLGIVLPRTRDQELTVPHGYPDRQIINILDNKVNYQQYEYFLYVLSKRALANATGLTAAEFSPFLRVNAISPGVVLPGSAHKQKEYLEYRRLGIPLRRLGNVNNIIQAMNYLIKNTFVTGEILTVDGGENMNMTEHKGGRNYIAYTKS